MTLGKVVGTVVATRKDEKLIGSKLLIVQDVNLEDWELLSKYTVAVDAVGAGIGETVPHRNREFRTANKGDEGQAC